MNVQKNRWIAAALLAIALVVGATAATGVFMRGGGETASAVSIRGEHYEYVTDGIYAYNAKRVVAEGVGWDAVTLGPLFPLFVLIYPAAAAMIVWIVSGIGVGGLSAHFDERFPRRGMAVFSLLMGLMLVLMWSKRIATGLSGDMAGAMMLGVPTLAVQALDLGIIVPLAVLTGVTALRRHAWGYLLVPVFAVKGVTMSGAIVAMLISAWMVEGKLDVGGAAIFGSATLTAAVLCWMVFRSVRATESVGASA